VNVKVYRFPFVDAGIGQKHCPNEFVTLNGSGTDYTRFTWSPATGLNDKNLMQPLASVTSKTTYTLNAWNNYCYNSDTVVVDVNPKIVAKFQALPDNGIAPLKVNFVNSSQNGNFYFWEFGEAGASGHDKDTSYTYYNEGVFNVKLTVKDSLGCSDTTSTTVRVIVNETIFAPSAFTPNGDGLNDEFAFKFAESRFEFLELSIYNRWGVKVFETKMPGGTWWDGKINGQPEPPGIFTFYAIAKDKKGKSYELSGTVAIVR
jgi:gliding motility-associated-like protein